MPFAPTSLGQAAIYAFGVVITGFLLCCGWQAGLAFCAWIT